MKLFFESWRRKRSLPLSDDYALHLYCMRMQSKVVNNYEEEIVDAIANRFNIENYKIAPTLRTSGQVNRIYIDDYFSIYPNNLELDNIVKLEDLQRYCSLDLSSLVAYFNGVGECFILNNLHSQEEDDDWRVISKDINKEYTDIVNQAFTDYIVDTYPKKCSFQLILDGCKESELSADYVKELLNSQLCRSCTGFRILNRNSKYYDTKTQFLIGMIQNGYIDDPSVFFKNLDM